MSRRQPYRFGRRAALLGPVQLSVAGRPMHGRREELARLDEWLAARGPDRPDARQAGPASGAPATVVISASGTAGVGKTALAVHWAHRDDPPGRIAG